MLPSLACICLPTTAGEDFQAVKMDVTFLSGVTEVMVSIPLLDNVFPEEEFENFEVVLSASPGVLIGSPSFVNFTIVDDDPPLPGVCVCVCVCVCACECVCVHMCV